MEKKHFSKLQIAKKILVLWIMLIMNIWDLDLDLELELELVTSKDYMQTSFSTSVSTRAALNYRSNELKCYLLM